MRRDVYAPANSVRHRLMVATPQHRRRRVNNAREHRRDSLLYGRKRRRRVAKRRLRQLRQHALEVLLEALLETARGLKVLPG